MKIKCLYRRNLKLSDQKLAAQVGHVVGNLVQLTEDQIDRDSVIIVLKASDKKFAEKHKELLDSKDVKWYIQIDRGITEILEGTETVIGWIEPKEVENE